MSKLGKCNRTTKKTIAGIYLIKNKLNNKLYVGKSLYVYQRLNQHKRELKNNTHANKYLQNSYNKYDLNNFEFLVYECAIDNLPKEELNAYLLKRELDLIYSLNSHISKNGFNITLEYPNITYNESYCQRISIACLDKNNKYYVAIKDAKFIFVDDLQDFCTLNALNYDYATIRKNLVSYKQVEYKFIKKWFIRYATKEEIDKKQVITFDNPEEEYINKPTWSKADIPGIFYNTKQDYYEVSVCLHNKKYQLSRFQDKLSAIECLTNFKSKYPTYSLKDIKDYRNCIKLQKLSNKGYIKKGKWYIARGQINNTKIILGKFLTEKEASKCYLKWKQSTLQS